MHFFLSTSNQLKNVIVEDTLIAQGCLCKAELHVARHPFVDKGVALIWWSTTE